MLFNSLEFALFFPIVFILYWIVASKKNLRNILLLIASYVFYGWWDWRFLFLIIISSLVDFLVGLYIPKTTKGRDRKILLAISLLVNLGFLVYFKYANFFIESFVDAFRLFGKELNVSTLNIILPVGISFYTFQTLSYTLDIYRKRLRPTKDALAFFTFVAFYPQLVAGPIERASHLLPQFYKTYTFKYEEVKSGLLLAAFGLFKKMVIADRLAILVNQVYNNPTDYSGFELVVATVFFSFQIYCDFSGYSDIAIGLSRAMGFDLMKNFNSPYFSLSITEFWRRWHISLSTWFRDYVYISLGGNRVGKGRMYFNLFATFLISGLWHGAAFTFVIWGFIHGVLIVAEKAFTKTREQLFNHFRKPLPSLLLKGGALLLTYALVCFAWIFFRANSLTDAIYVAKGIWTNNIGEVLQHSIFELGLSKPEFLAGLFFIGALVLLEATNQRRSVSAWLNKQWIGVRWTAYIGLILVIIIFGMYGDNTPKEFIYFQF